MRRRPLATAFLLLVPAALVLRPAPLRAQFGYPPIFYPGYQYAVESHLKIKVKPAEAQVYVDGYFAGKVDQFDGAFQRLHVAPGEHEIVIYAEGFRSLRQKLYLSPNATRTIEATLEALSPGEPIEPIPTPAPDSDRYARAELNRMPPPRGPFPPHGQPESDEPRDRRVPPGDGRSRPGAPEPATSGTLSIRVQPAGATVLIDGEPWIGPADDERLIVQLPEGRHRVDVEREGYAHVVVDVDVRRGETVPINVSLTSAR